MYKSLAGLAAAAMLTTVAASSPANAFAVRHAPGVAQDQATVEHVWHRGYPHRRYYRGYRGYGGFYGPRRFYGGGPYYYGGGPYAYGAPYPYYRRHYHYGPRPFIGIGPVGIGIW
jgi:hypothetical protein